METLAIWGYVSAFGSLALLALGLWLLWCFVSNLFGF